MAPTLRSLLLVLAVVVAAVALRPATRPAEGGVASAAFAAPTAGSRTQGVIFDGVSPGDRQAVLAAVAGAQPDARRLMNKVGGLVTVRVGPAGGGAAGSTQPTRRGYDVVLDLALVSRTLGRRGIERLVFHEFGHVVDFALVPDATLAALDAGIPRGYGCEQGRLGACADREERFAESFAKWAADDIGVNLSVGYKVPPPALSLATWAAPLTQLAG
ncbi:MAG: hypothetical protein AVDCRST_MAG53-1250 [uncultured Solirubrobacteraceae bacterium]|uniref:Uncharacterized protein n=1 Tax=uncultured Solirubrobacteraceae bacterium TaxID=1162706 RepID=A0A6J4RCU2_9ACTN|nr:MAG: hypothetical protein AVDCRST_MAG53-1250 [uncultured Solirubrobacteraceae bacterium]